MLSTLLLALPALCPQGTTVYVPDQYATIQDALYAVAAGDTVVVRPGTYVEYGINFLGKDLTLVSEAGPEQTVIDAMGLGSVVEFQGAETAAAVLDGFTITGGKRWDGGGISIVADPLNVPSSPTIQNCIIEGNTGDGGGGGMNIAGGSSSVVRNCLIQDNVTTYYHGAGVVIFDSTPVFESCTIRNNTAAGQGGAFAVWNQGSDLYLNGCILQGNSPRNIDRIGMTGAVGVLAEYSLCQGDGPKFWFGTGCIDDDARFAAGPQGDAYLSQVAAGQALDSPCLDAGDPARAAYGTTRTDGRPDTGALDIGYHHALRSPVLSASNLVAGALASFQITNVNPGELCVVGYSRFGGGPINSPFGPVYLTPPYGSLPPVAADPQGVAGIQVPVPPAAAGLTIWFHALNQTAGLLSNPLTEVVQ
jgi:hypothetical protein